MCDKKTSKTLEEWNVCVCLKILRRKSTKWKETCVCGGLFAPHWSIEKIERAKKWQNDRKFPWGQLTLDKAIPSCFVMNTVSLGVQIEQQFDKTLMQEISTSYHLLVDFMRVCVFAPYGKQSMLQSSQFPKIQFSMLFNGLAQDFAILLLSCLGLNALNGWYAIYTNTHPNV